MFRETSCHHREPGTAETDKQLLADTDKQLLVDTDKQLLADTDKQLLADTDRQLLADTDRQLSVEPPNLDRRDWSLMEFVHGRWPRCVLTE